MLRLNLAVVLTIMCIFVSGCAKKTQIDSPKPLCLGRLEMTSAFSAAEQALIEMDFHIDKMDTQIGLIRTRPLEGSQFFELWRKDNADSYKGQMSNIHSLRRVVDLNFRNNNGQLCIECTVILSRLSMPEQKITSSANAYSIYSESDKNKQTLHLDAQQRKRMEWVKLGRDPNLETVILERIQKKILINKEDGKL
ncbi:MAG: hypothetical protein K8R02_08430 [Anaerohalosphaeraceae bacterium]|nr:hypothetical protein [Anaerohalosphaeraceae bacterium]